jgi:hypothetical protein
VFACACERSCFSPFGLRNAPEFTAALGPYSRCPDTVLYGAVAHACGMDLETALAKQMHQRSMLEDFSST